MSSSTSNSRAGAGGEWKAIALAAAALLLFECAMRMEGGVLSTDLLHIREIPRVADELASRDGIRVLFLGNSLIREGFDSGALAESLDESSKAPIEVRSVFPDDTTIVEWSALFQHYFIDADRAPDVLVLGFARDHLSDATTVHPERLGRFYTGLSDIPRIFRYDVVDFGGRVDYLLAYASSAFGNRERVPRRFFDLWVPHFREARSEINRNLRAGPSRPASGAIRSYTRLERFARLLKEQEVRGIAVAMPLRDEYPLDGRLRETLGAAGVELIDARSVLGLARTSYRDSMHLTREGARVYSRWLGRRLAADLARKPE